MQEKKKKISHNMRKYHTQDFAICLGVLDIYSSFHPSPPVMTEY